MVKPEQQPASIRAIRVRLLAAVLALAAGASGVVVAIELVRGTLG